MAVSIALGPRVAEDVDRVVEVRRRRQRLVQRVHGFLGQRGHLQPAALDRVGGDDAGPAGIGDESDVRAADALLIAERQAPVEEVHDLARAKDARLPEGGGIGVVGAGERAGVARGGLRAGGRHAGLEEDHRFAPRDLPGGAHEFLAVLDGLDIAEQHARVVVGADRFEERGLVHVGLVADADELAEADPLADRPVEDRRAERARLRHESDVARRGHAGGEGGVELLGRVDQAEAVRPDDAHAARVRELDDLALEIGAFAAGLLEAGGDDDQRRHFLRGAVARRLQAELRRDHQHRQVHFAGNLPDRRKTGQAQNLVRLGIDRVDPAGIAVLDQVVKHVVADLAFLARRADDRHGTGVEETFEHVLLPEKRENGSSGAGRNRGRVVL